MLQFTGGKACIVRKGNGAMLSMIIIIKFPLFQKIKGNQSTASDVNTKQLGIEEALKNVWCFSYNQSSRIQKRQGRFI